MKNSKKPKASVQTLGCRLNQYEGLAIEGKLRDKGYEIVPFGEKADLGVINTCTVTNEADAKSRNTIRRFTRNNPTSITVVVGCYSQTSANDVAMVDGVDYVIGNHDKINFLDYVAEGKPSHPVVVRERIDRSDFSIGYVGDVHFEQRANLKIQDGCDFMCSFCVIPFARGRARSREWDDLFGEARQMIARGVREIVLTGVNVGTYDSNGKNFLKLIESLSSLTGLDRLRISSIEPTTIPTELFEWMEDDLHPLMPYLHVPMQSGCDKILSLMKRRYNLREMNDFFMQAIEAIPEVCIGTDLMTGYPGETAADFEQTCNTFLEFPFSYCHVFTYSERSGTPAEKSKVHIPMEERRRRSSHMRRLSSSKRMKWHETFIGKSVRVLLENPKNGFYGGYTENYLKVIVPENIPALANLFVKVKISEVRPEYCLGEILSVDQ
ncbi:tRNA (N(6)-L-threonylcarbamoyladenosine(37)-C(2))-methylthiotransferase MtaB [Opitutales bacterium]|nr:tRNA (N(6)-L-threonylcarbamoyladenosine(37)-C(2))-methylthiotransferase MtaB [Opitutales bacterium]